MGSGPCQESLQVLKSRINCQNCKNSYPTTAWIQQAKFKPSCLTWKSVIPLWFKLVHVNWSDLYILWDAVFLNWDPIFYLQKWDCDICLWNLSEGDAQYLSLDLQECSLGFPVAYFSLKNIQASIYPHIICWSFITAQQRMQCLWIYSLL